MQKNSKIAKNFPNSKAPLKRGAKIAAKIAAKGAAKAAQEAR